MAPSPIWEKSMESKKDIRCRILKLRDALDTQTHSKMTDAIIEQVLKHPAFVQADEIYSYVDYRSEVGTKKLIREALSLHKRVAVPKVHGDDMDFCYIESLDELKKGSYGILEPANNRQVLCPQGLMLIPGAVFDLTGARIGYGKGYYDRYISKYKMEQTMALAFSFQVLDRIPTNEHDRSVRWIVTEEKIYDGYITKGSGDASECD